MAEESATALESGHSFNGTYEGAALAHIAFPMGGFGAGMICLEGAGALSKFSLRHRPDLTTVSWQTADARRNAVERSHLRTLHDARSGSRGSSPGASIFLPFELAW